MDFLLNRILSFSSNSKEMAVVKVNNVQNLVDNWTSVSPQIPTDIRQFLSDSNFISDILSTDQVPTGKVPNYHCPKLFNNSFSGQSFAFSPHISQFLKDCVRNFSNWHTAYQYSYLDTMFEPASYLTKQSDMSNKKSNIAVDSNQCEMPICDLNSLVKCDVLADFVGTIPKTVKSSLVSDNLAGSKGLSAKSECKKSVCDYNLNIELATRKTKELQKRSKKRRRRQKRGKGEKSKLSNSPNDVNASVSLKHSNFKPLDFVCDIFYDSNFHFNENDFFPEGESSSGNVHIVVPEVGSLFISVDAVSDEDADWDETDCSDWNPADFELSGLFISNLSVTEFSTSQKEASSNCSYNSSELDEIKKLKAMLDFVNKTWNEATKDIDHEPKVPSRVTFADEIDLIQICPVELYDRKGEWELYALERSRFQRRIDDMNTILSPYLSVEHRQKVYQKLQAAL